MKAVSARILDETHLELSQPLPDAPAGRIEILIAGAGDAGELAEASARGTSPSDQATKRGTRLREREDVWCRSHPEILRRYAGQWLVVEGEQIVAHGEDPARLVKLARAQGVRIPYVFYVEKPRSGVVRLGL